MTVDDIAILKRVYAEWAIGKFFSFDRFHDDVQTRWATEVPDIEGAQDVEGLADLLREWSSAWEICRIEAEEFHDAGDNRVVVYVRVHARGSGSAIDVDMRNAHVWTMRDGRAAAIRAYTDRERAMREAGLRE